MTSSSSPVLRQVPGLRLTAGELHTILMLRISVFVVEQDCPYQEVDGRDLEEGTRHFWLSDEDSDRPLAYLRTLTEPGGVVRIGRVCTARDARGSGLGRRLMDAVMAVVGDVECVLDSQTYAQGFYARFGFLVDGQEYVEDGIPHIRMRRPVSARTV